jgi:hypothetical protein
MELKNEDPKRFLCKFNPRGGGGGEITSPSRNKPNSNFLIRCLAEPVGGVERDHGQEHLGRAGGDGQLQHRHIVLQAGGNRLNIEDSYRTACQSRYFLHQQFSFNRGPL